jgi:catechol 2,3-dioxygenase-like lactoylglutathione lyase family enzyme
LIESPRSAELNVSTPEVTGPVHKIYEGTDRLAGRRALVTGRESGFGRQIVQPLKMNHIALHVPNIEQAIRFYTEILNFRSLKCSNLRYRRADNPDAPIFRIYDDDELNEVVIAFLSTSDGVGLELFQFIDPPMSEQASFNYRRGGVFHFAITHPNPEELVQRVVVEGGKRIGETVTLSPSTTNMNAKVALYFQDPWGNTVEAMNSSFEEMTTYV